MSGSWANADTEITFRNVTITMPVGVGKDGAKVAYAKLCEALQEIGAEWATDTYEITGSDPVEERDASELWGK